MYELLLFLHMENQVKLTLSSCIMAAFDDISFSSLADTS